jgi:hypothetical protein
MSKTLLKFLYRLLKWVLLAFIIYGLAQTWPPELALLFAGDTLAYVEVAAALWLAAQVTRVRWASAYLRLSLGPPLRRLRRRAGRALRALGRLAARRSQDDDRGWGALAPA